MALQAIVAGVTALNRAGSGSRPGVGLFIDAACAAASELPIEQLGPAVEALCRACEHLDMVSADSMISVCILAQQAARKSALDLDAESFARSAAGRSKRPGKRGRQAAASKKLSEDPGAERSVSLCVSGLVGIGKHATKSLKSSVGPACRVLEAVTASFASIVAWLPVPCARAHARQVTVLLESIVSATARMAHARLHASAFRARQFWGGGTSSKQLVEACELLQTAESRSLTEIANAASILAAHLSIAPTADAVQLRRDLGRSDSTACPLDELALLFAADGISAGGLVLAVCRLLDVATTSPSALAGGARHDESHHTRTQVAVAAAIQLLAALLRHEAARTALIPYAHRLDAALRGVLHAAVVPVFLHAPAASAAAVVLASIARLSACSFTGLVPPPALFASSAAAVMLPFVIPSSDAVVVQATKTPLPNHAFQSSASPAAVPMALPSHEAAVLPKGVSASRGATMLTAAATASGRDADSEGSPAAAASSSVSLPLSIPVATAAVTDGPEGDADSDGEFPDIV